MSTRTVYFHEDDYCQIELLPESNWDFCAAQIGKIAEFSEQHRAADGVGWTDVYVRKGEPIALSALCLRAEDVSTALSGYLTPFQLVETGYASQKEQCKDVRAFGFDSNCVVYFAHDDTGGVERIWLGLGGPNQSERAALVAAFGKLNELADLLIVDWGWDCVFLLADAEGVATYLAEREGHIQAFDEEMRRQERLRLEAKKPRWWKFWA